MKISILCLLLLFYTPTSYANFIVNLGTSAPKVSQYVKNSQIPPTKIIAKGTMENKESFSIGSEETIGFDMTDRDTDFIDDFSFKSLTFENEDFPIQVELIEETSIFTNVISTYPTKTQNSEAVNCKYRTRTVSSVIQEIPLIKLEIKEMITFEWAGYAIVPEGLYGMYLKDQQSVLVPLSVSLIAPTEVKEKIKDFIRVYAITFTTSLDKYFATLSKDHKLYFFNIIEKGNSQDDKFFYEQFVFYFDISSYVETAGEPIAVEMHNLRIAVIFKTEVLTFLAGSPLSGSLNDPTVPDNKTLHDQVDGQSFTVLAAVRIQNYLILSLKGKGLYKLELNGPQATLFFSHPNVRTLSVIHKSSLNVLQVAVEQDKENDINEFALEFIIINNDALLNKVYTSDADIDIHSIKSTKFSDYLLDQKNGIILLKRNAVNGNVREHIFQLDISNYKNNIHNHVLLFNRDLKEYKMFFVAGKQMTELKTNFAADEKLECKFPKDGTYKLIVYTNCVPEDFLEDCRIEYEIEVKVGAMNYVLIIVVISILIAIIVIVLLFLLFSNRCAKKDQKKENKPEKVSNTGTGREARIEIEVKDNI